MADFFLITGAYLMFGAILFWLSAEGKARERMPLGEVVLILLLSAFMWPVLLVMSGGRLWRR